MTTTGYRHACFHVFLWDGENDQHLVQHHVTPEEFEYVVMHARSVDFSHSSGRPVVFGETANGRRLASVYEEIDEITCYPVTAYEVP